MQNVKNLFFGLFTAILLLTPNIIFPKETAKEAKITLLRGDVKVQKSGSAKWIGAKLSMVLSEADTLKTGRSSFVEIAFDRDNKNLIRLEENSTAILRGKKLDQIELPHGRIRCLVKSLKKDTSFEIRTPTVVAGARGSGWDVICESARDTVKAFEDEIFVKSFDEEGNLIKEISVREGWETFIERFQGPSELIELTDMDRNDWNSWKEDLIERSETDRTQSQEAPKPAEFSNIETIQREVIQKQEDYKEQISEIEDIKKVDDRVADENKTATESGNCTGGGHDYNP